MTKLIITFSLIAGLLTNLVAQSFIGKQHSLQIGSDGMMALYSGDEDLDKMANFFFALDYNDIVKKAKANGVNTETDEGTLYVDGKLFRMDTETMGQKMSFIINLETREMYSIMHDQKEYFAMNLDDMKAMQAKVKESVSAQMENMKGMMENMPPEARAMMEKMSGQKKTVPPKVTATGKSKTINGFPCTEYLVSKENSREQLWITTKNSGLRDAFYEMATSMPGAEEENAMWDQIKDGWPVRSSEVTGREDYMDGSFSIHEVYSLKEATHKPGTFDPPANYKKKTMQEMMGGMQGYPQE